MRRLLVVAAILAVLVGAGAGYAIYRNNQIGRVTVSGITAVPPSGVENILLVGSNSRCALNGQQGNAFGTCSQVGGARSDVTMLLHLDPRNHTASILSIPRDLFVPIPGTSSENRVDDALNVGPSRLVKTIEEDLGISINHYVELNFDSFQGVVNALGGIDMYFPDPVKDAYSALNVSTPGCHHLNGFEALAVVRARHLYYEVDGTWHYDGLGDLSRIKRDHEFLKVLASTLSKRGLGNPLTDNAILGSVTGQLTVDSHLGLGDMLGLLLTFHSVNPSGVPTATLPVVVDPNTYWYKGYDYGDVVFPSAAEDRQAIDQFLGVSSPQGSTISPSSFTVSVLNGTGTASQAADTAASLQALGFHVGGTGDATSVGPISETVVSYAPGKVADAERVAEELSGTVTMGQGPTYGGADVTVTTGSDFSVNAPAGGSSGAAASQGGSSSAGANGSSSALSPPTAASSPLPAWDPRSCTPQGGPGT